LDLYALEQTMPGMTMSFVADPELVERLKEIARSDGVSQSQAAARAAALGALLPSAARRNVRLLLAEDGTDVQNRLAVLLSRAVAQVSNEMLQKRLVERSPVDLGPEEAIAEEAVRAVAKYRRAHQEQPDLPSQVPVAAPKGA